MWLLDASQINVGGAVSILKMVLAELESQSIDYLVIRDKRLPDGILDTQHSYTPSHSILKRKATYRKLIKDYQIERVVSLISIPPPMKLNVPVHTYFHNVNLLSNANLSNSGIVYRLLQQIKNRYIKGKLKNTDYYTFQSPLIKADFAKDFGFQESKCNVYPFYDETEIIKVKKKNFNKTDSSFIYVSSDYPHKNHKRLLDSWQVLLNKGYTPLLKLTVPFSNVELCNRIADLNAIGCNIINLGVIDYVECLEQTAKSQYCIFPSLSESLGLGLVEGQLLESKVIVSNLEYAYQAINPSLTFDPYQVDAIADSVVKALSETTPETHLIMKNKLTEWIGFIKKSSKLEAARCSDQSDYN